MSQQSNQQSQKQNPSAHGEPNKPGMQFRPDQNVADPKDPKNPPPTARDREPEDDDNSNR